MHPMVERKNKRYAKALQILLKPMTKNDLQMAMGNKDSNTGEMLKNLLGGGNVRIVGKWLNPETGRHSHVYQTINSVYINVEEPQPKHEIITHDKSARVIKFDSQDMQDKLIESDKLRTKERKSPKVYIGGTYRMTGLS
jgi:hypothetical protein